MVHAARQMFEAMRQSADPARTEALHAEYEQHWTRVREAAEALDRSAAAPLATPMDVATAEVDALLEERRALRGTLAARNRELKDQIDRLRDLLCAMQVSGVR